MVFDFNRSINYDTIRFLELYFNYEKIKNISIDAEYYVKYYFLIYKYIKNKLSHKTN